MNSVVNLTHLLANLTLLFFFASAFSVFSELYEFVSKYVMGYQFDSSGFDTWLDIMANMGGALVGYVGVWIVKSRKLCVPPQVKMEFWTSKIRHFPSPQPKL